MQSMKWEKARKSGIMPSPRAAFGCTTHKRRLIVFGGVQDQEKGDDITSTFLNDMHALRLETMRWSATCLGIAVLYACVCTQPAYKEMSCTDCMLEFVTQVPASFKSRKGKVEAAQSQENKRVSIVCLQPNLY